jgi:dynein heavy chain
VVQRYSIGLTKLQDAAVNVSELSEELKIKQVEVNKEKDEVELLIDDILHKSEITSINEEKAMVKKKDLDEKNKEISIKKAEADEILENAIPILESAKAALNNIQ